MKLASYITIAIVLSWAILTLFQLWGIGLSWILYIKTTITMAIVGGATIIVSLIYREHIRNKRIEEKN